MKNTFVEPYLHIVMKKILGLDIGTNSIGWAVVSSEIKNDGIEVLNKIVSAGSRIIPMDAAALGNFDKGNLESQTAVRTRLRSVRRLLERRLLRRERLHRVLATMNFLPGHYREALDRYGKFKVNKECKLAWKEDEAGLKRFVFLDAFNEMLDEFWQHHPDLRETGKKIPYDWTLYYLRKKALSQAVSKEELAWIILSFNQKRGYYQLRDDKEEDSSKKTEDYYALKVVNVTDSGSRKGSAVWYNVELENGWVYSRPSNVPLSDWIGQMREFIVSTQLDNTGQPKKDRREM